jgi:hypothetical protein
VTARHQIIIRDEGLRQRVLDVIGKLNLDKLWQVTIEPYRKKRSLSQNALMWKWIDEVVKHVYETTGQDKDDIHLIFKQKFANVKCVGLGGDEYLVRSTRKMTTAEMSTYMDAIYAFCTSELGLFLPLPEEMGR